MSYVMMCAIALQNLNFFLLPLLPSNLELHPSYTPPPSLPVKCPHLVDPPTHYLNITNWKVLLKSLREAT